MADTERSQGMVGEGDWIDDKYSSFHNPEMETGSIDAHPNMLKYPSLDDYRSKHITDPLTEEEVEFRLTEHDAKLTTPRLLQTVIQAIISAFDHSGQVYVTGESTECVITLAVPNSAVDKLKQVLAENSLFVEEVGVRTIKFGKNGQKLEIRSTTRRDIKSHSLDFGRANPVCRSLQDQLTVNLMQTLKILMKQKHRSSGMEQEDRGRLERLVRQLEESQEKLAVEQSERSRLAERLKNSEEEVKTLKENYGN
ncbi:uncharacterized protein [Ptychodera flava]|uniref:uncharacterized protein isoform X2 n=1 Tax=Ptychodera flava TaxID=63121 RepID=UPI00396A764A